MPKLLVLAHGIGQAPADFYKEWETKIRANLGSAMNGVTVKGLWWQDELQKVQDRYPLVQSTFADMIAQFGHDQLKTVLTNENWKTFQTFMMDVLVYVGLPDMWLYILNECTKKLHNLRLDEAGNEQFAEEDTILVGHSLGAGMLPQLVWKEFVATATIAYRGLILLASPLGFHSPIPVICQDFLQRLGAMHGGDRNSTLTKFASAWTAGGPNRLRFISNTNDIVCSDVSFPIPLLGTLDPIPVQQGFSSEEIQLLNTTHPGSFQAVTFGTRALTAIASNHDVMTYLDQQAFIDSLKTLLS